MPCTLSCKEPDGLRSQARSSINQRRRFFAFFWNRLDGRIYLFRWGLSSTEIGLVIAMGLAGATSATLLMAIEADRIGRKWFLVLLSVLSTAGGIALVLSPSVRLLGSIALIGMLNGTGTDRSAAFALDQAIMPGLGSDTRRTWNLAWYNVLLDGGGSLGALAAGLPIMLQHRMSVTVLRSYRLVFLGYSVLCLIVAAAYLCLSPSVEAGCSQMRASGRTRITPESKKVVAKITALFSLDVFGGAF